MRAVTLTLFQANDNREKGIRTICNLGGSNVAKPKEPKAGEKLTAEEAKAYVDYLYATLYKAWNEKIHNGAFHDPTSGG